MAFKRSAVRSRLAPPLSNTGFGCGPAFRGSREFPWTRAPVGILASPNLAEFIAVSCDGCMSGPMTEVTYQAYRVSWQGCLYWPPIAIEARTDSEAIERARQIVADAAVEIR